MRTLNEYFLMAHEPSVNVGGNVVVPIPDGGVLKTIYTAVDKTFVGNTILTVYVRNVSVGTYTLVASGSTNQSVFEFTPTESTPGDAHLAVGDVIKIASDGGSSTASLECNHVFVIRR